MEIIFLVILRLASSLSLCYPKCGSEKHWQMVVLAIITVHMVTTFALYADTHTAVHMQTHGYRQMCLGQGLKSGQLVVLGGVMCLTILSVLFLVGRCFVTLGLLC